RRERRWTRFARHRRRPTSSAVSRRPRTSPTSSASWPPRARRSSPASASPSMAEPRAACTREPDPSLTCVASCHYLSVALGWGSLSRRFHRGQEVRAMAAKLFVGNLSFQATEEDLRELFAQAGTVETVRIITDQFTGRPRGFGFVEMATKEEAQKAVEMLNGRLFRDRNLVVDEARPQPQRGGGGGDRGGRPGGGRPGGGGGGGGGWRR